MRLKNQWAHLINQTFFQYLVADGIRPTEAKALPKVPTNKSISAIRLSRSAIPNCFAHKHRLRGLHPHKDKYWETVFNWTSCFKSATSPSILKTDSVTIKVRSNFPTFFKQIFQMFIIIMTITENAHRLKRMPSIILAWTNLSAKIKLFVVVKAGKIPRLAW